MKVVLLFSQLYPNFRIAELQGISHAFGINFDISQINNEGHLFLVDMESEQDARKLLSRSMLLKSAYFHIFMASSCENLCGEITRHREVFKVFDHSDQSFSVTVHSVGRRKGVNCLKMASEFASLLPLDAAPVDLNNPSNSFTILTEFPSANALEPSRLFFCKLARLKTLYNIKDRLYIGNTTMDPELAFIQSNASSVRANDLVLDPFMGTGGLLLCAAEFGAYTLGTEINYQIAKAIGKSSRHDVSMRSTEESVKANFEQYGTDRYFLSGILADACWHDLWARPLFNAIITDPPYGIREKGRKIGRKPRKDHWTLAKADYDCHFPEKQPYSLETTFTDLCDLAAKTLLIGSKLSFWFPVIIERYCTRIIMTDLLNDRQDKAESKQLLY
ncbi:hypothetical protein KIN20_021966 [Parelaphostrongylus tenuis]|uniref:tRNA (guanine(10)-N(2))-methyltransferase TRMT11 n=1 Tax=Parelaphostrongylus tenuis TaxID=148309 RepID=A0AAD5QRY0_PARTN|nr:hypothetical protein KIN20_021966 [Parelaphostrongylus tenuis]